MNKYLHQLVADIAFSIEMSSHLPELDWVTEYENSETEISICASKLMSLPAICNISAEAFPPEKLLTNLQVSQLNTEILKMWSSWRVWVSLPPNLPDRQKYTALVHAMHHELVVWSMVKGGYVNVCQFASGSFCPFGATSGYCYCKILDESVRQDLAIWEEHVRSQGLDPYLDLTEDEEAAFEASKKNRNLQNQVVEDWLSFDLNENTQSYEDVSKNEIHPERPVLEDDWSQYLFCDDYGKNDSQANGNSEDLIVDDII